MANTTKNSQSLLTPEQVQALVIKPLQQESVALQVCSNVLIGAKSTRFPTLDEDAAAGWVLEGEDIDLSQAVFNEVNSTPTKVAGLAKLSTELVEDSSDDAASVIGQSIVRSLKRKIDQAFFSGSGVDPVPAGLNTIDSEATQINSGGSWGPNLDPFIDAAGAAADLDAPLTSWVTTGADWRSLAKLKVESGSNVPLLATDPTQPGRRLIEGLPVLSSPDAPASVVYGVPKSRVIAVIRRDVQVVTDNSFFFGSDSVAVRSTMRVTFAYLQPEAVVKVNNQT